jgi:hypothetical protein
MRALWRDLRHCLTSYYGYTHNHGIWQQQRADGQDWRHHFTTLFAMLDISLKIVGLLSTRSDRYRRCQASAAFGDAETRGRLTPLPLLQLLQPGQRSAEYAGPICFVFQLIQAWSDLNFGHHLSVSMKLERQAIPRKCVGSSLGQRDVEIGGIHDSHQGLQLSLLSSNHLPSFSCIATDRALLWVVTFWLGANLLRYLGRIPLVTWYDLEGSCQRELWFHNLFLTERLPFTERGLLDRAGGCSRIGIWHEGSQAPGKHQGAISGLPAYGRRQGVDDDAFTTAARAYSRLFHLFCTCYVSHVGRSRPTGTPIQWFSSGLWGHETRRGCTVILGIFNLAKVVNMYLTLREYLARYSHIHYQLTIFSSNDSVITCAHTHRLGGRCSISLASGKVCRQAPPEMQTVGRSTVEGQKFRCTLRARRDTLQFLILLLFFNSF